MEGRSINSNAVHPLKAFSPIKVTEEDIVIFFNEIQPENALSPIFLIFDGMLISVNFLHPLNSSSFILFPTNGNKMLTISKQLFSAAILNTDELLKKN